MSKKAGDTQTFEEYVQEIRKEVFVEKFYKTLRKHQKDETHPDDSEKALDKDLDGPLSAFSDL